MILPTLLEANAPGYRPIKYALFPPLGLAGLAGYLDDNDEVELVDEHVQTLSTDDEPDLVLMTVYITSAKRAYAIADEYRARGVHVCLGGLHPTSLPDEAALHADTVFIGPGEDTWPRFLRDFRNGVAHGRYVSEARTLENVPPLRRDLIDRRRYLCPNSLVVSRGCPHHCDFCYKDAFFEGGRSFYTLAVDAALAEVERLPGRHLYFLDDHLLGSRRFATAFFDGMRGMGRVFQGASTVAAILQGDLIERAAEAGMRSVFVGFETLDPENLRLHAKRQNLAQSYDAAIRRYHEVGVMVNGSFVFGLDADGPDVFERTVDWAVSRSIETATFHIMTPLPRHGPARKDEQRGPHHRNRMGPLRHAPRRLHAARDDTHPACRRLLARLQRLLPLAENHQRRTRPRNAKRGNPPHDLCRRLEEVRAALGHGHQGKTRSRDTAAARADTRRVRPRATNTHTSPASRPLAYGTLKPETSGQARGLVLRGLRWEPMFHLTVWGA